VKTIISKLELAICNMKLIHPNGGFQEDVVNEVKRNITWAIAELKAPPRWETPEQYRERTGRDWLDHNAVYVRQADGSSPWIVKQHLEAKVTKWLVPITVICATEAGCPPDSWRPKEP
jgi:hypothetical protein